MTIGTLVASASAIPGPTSRPVYAVIVAVALAGLFFSNVPTYAALFVWSIQPLHFLIVFEAALCPLLVGRQALSLRLASPFVLWCLIYLALCAIWYAAFAGGEPEPLQARLLAILFMLSAYALFKHSETVVRAVRFTLLGCVLLAVLVNAYHITHPFTLVPSTSEYAIIGRAAGLYVNPNQSGMALLLGFLLTVDLCKPRWRAVYAFIVCGGVLLTASRAAMLGAVVVIGMLTWSGSLRPRQVLAMCAAFGVLGALASWLFAPALAALDLDWGALLRRVNWFLDLGASADFSQRERALLAEKAWALIEQYPFFGAGLGATELWSARTSTHNMYLAAMAEFGVLGILILPALVGACTGGLRRMFRRDRAAFTVFVLVIGLFSHNIISDWYFMVALSLMAALSEHEHVTRASEHARERLSNA